MIHPVILCGGSGTRLWPLSRKSYPKQFAPLLGARSLFQETALRLGGEGYAAPTVLTSADYRFVVTEQLAEAGIDPGPVLIEPEPRNTGPAVLAAALHLAASDPDALMLVAPSDHVIGDVAAFRAAVSAGAAPAQGGALVTFGIAPDRPETGYGWLELDEPAEPGVPVTLRRFIEKPDQERAEAMLAAGSYLWNAGIFLMSARAAIAAFEAHAPDLVTPVRRALDQARTDLGFCRLDPEAWAEAESISIDYAVMERAAGLRAVPVAADWSDLGDWEAVRRIQGPDSEGVTTSGPVTALDCRDSLLRSESPDLELVGLGLENIIAVAMPDAVLIADRRRAQDIRRVVPALSERGARQATALPRDFRPWGWFDSLVTGERFQVKRIVVNPGAALSLQSHMHRSEHWIVVRGTARVTIGEDVQLVTENQSVYVPLGERHRLENPGRTAMVLIEVQTGSYLGEDDIIRYEDVYARD
ncbi:MAG: mannose-1-phosphate guanylyltransferase/mannose-6-phosphate isomerase [Paracoccaceae bacterium]